MDPQARLPAKVLSPGEGMHADVPRRHLPDFSLRDLHPYKVLEPFLPNQCGETYNHFQMDPPVLKHQPVSDHLPQVQLHVRFLRPHLEATIRQLPKHASHLVLMPPVLQERRLVPVPFPWLSRLHPIPKDIPVEQQCIQLTARRPAALGLLRRGRLHHRS